MINEQSSQIMITNFTCSQVKLNKMPQNKFAMARYRLIDQELRRKSTVKTSYLVEKCREELGYDVTQRTIQLDIYHMRFDTFLGMFAPIEYDKRLKAYYYAEADYVFMYEVISDTEIKLLHKVKKLVKGRISDTEHKILSEMIRRLEKKQMTK